MRMNTTKVTNRLFFFFFLVITALSGLALLSPDTAGATASKRRSKSKVNMLLRIETDDKGGNINNLLSDANMALTNEDSGMMDRLGEAELIDTSLETALKEILDLQGKDVIKLHTRLIEHTDTNKTANEGIAFKKTLGILLFKSEKFTRKRSRSTVSLRLRQKDDCLEENWLRTERHDGFWTR